MANNDSNTEETGSILDTIREQTTNIESYTNKLSLEMTISEELKKVATKERTLRESTISIKSTPALDMNNLNKLLEKEWTMEHNKPPPIYWQDKTYTYVQFIDQENKREFLERVKDSRGEAGIGALKGLITPTTADGNNFIRKEIKMEITNVREKIKIEKINALLKNSSDRDMFFSEIRTGKLFGSEGRKQRSLMFRTNSFGFQLLFNKWGGAIPYSAPDENISLKLWPRINVRPWSCRECYYIGPNHQQCPGKSCAQCGGANHLTKTCRSKTRYCTNCRRKGHKAKDSHCPIYIKEIVKEIKRIDIPLEFLEDDTKRFDLARSLIYK